MTQADNQPSVDHAQCIRPYYDDGTCVIYHGDALEVIPALIPGSADLLVTDPPYGVGFISNFRGRPLAGIVGDDGTLDVPAVLGAALRVLRDNRHVYVFGRFDLTGLPLGASSELVWDKGGQMGMGDLTLPWGPAHEVISFAVKATRPAQRARGQGSLSARLRKGSIIRVPRRSAGQMEDHTVRHPTEKPVGLLRQLIESSSVLDEIVFDPFMGSGSTLVAAAVEGRRAVGIEIEERHCEMAAKRLMALQAWQEEYPA